MKPTTRMKFPSDLLEQVNQADDISTLSSQVLQGFKARMPLTSALLVTGNPVQAVSPDGFPSERLQELRTRFESNPDFLTDLGERPGHVCPSESFPDGSEIVFLPFIHEDKLEAVLCLLDKDREIRHHMTALKSMLPVCDSVAPVFARLRISREAQRQSMDPSFIASRVTGIIAHDLRTPVTVIHGYLKLLSSGRLGSLTDEQKKCVEGAMNGVGDLANIAGTVGRASELLEQTQLQIVDLHNLWAFVASRVQPKALEKGITIREFFPDEAFRVCVDSSIMNDVLETLALRAVMLAEAGTEVKVQASSARTANVILRIVFRCGPPEPGVAGLVSELQVKVCSHGGQLSFNSAYENGSAFTLSLPGYCT